MTDQLETPESGISDAIAQAVAVIASMPLDQRKVLTVAVASDLTYQDIASQGGFSSDQVLAWMREGLHTIASAFDEESGQEFDSQ